MHRFLINDCTVFPGYLPHSAKLLQEPLSDQNNREALRALKQRVENDFWSGPFLRSEYKNVPILPVFTSDSVQPREPSLPLAVMMIHNDTTNNFAILNDGLAFLAYRRETCT